MGNYSEAHCIAEFDKDENAQTAYQNFNSFVDKANSHQLGGEFDIDVTEKRYGCIEYTVRSGREINCIWQCQKILEFFKTQLGIRAVYQNVMVASDSVDWFVEDGDE